MILMLSPPWLKRPLTSSELSEPSANRHEQGTLGESDPHDELSEASANTHRTLSSYYIVTSGMQQGIIDKCRNY